MPQVDIIIRSKDGEGMLDDLLESIDANTADDMYRIILSDDGSVPPLAYDDHRIDFCVKSTKSQGAVSATNLGLAVALTKHDSEYVLVMDNDTEIPEGDTGWLDRMISELEQYGEETACVGATSTKVDLIQQALHCTNTYTADWEDGPRSGSKENPTVPTFVSFCVLFRKSVLRELGPWDERYNPGNWEDTDYAIQVRNAGYKIRVARSVYIHHHSHQTFGKDQADLMERNQAEFAKKWGLGRLWDMSIIPSKQIAIVAGRHSGILKESK